MNCPSCLQMLLIYTALNAACHGHPVLLSIRQAEVQKKASLQCQQHAADQCFPDLLHHIISEPPTR